MGVLAAAAIAVVLAGCYSPSLRDCTVSCSNATDCAGGQVCGADGMCAAPDKAGHCDVAEIQDAAMPDPDATNPDLVIIHVRVMGMGTIMVNQTPCNAESTMPNDCMIPVAAVPTTIKAIDGRDAFQMWTSQACTGQAATCTITPSAPVTDVSAKFMKDG